MFGNGNVDHAMRSFPPEPDMLKDTFVAVFAGADDDADGIPLTDEEKQARALRAMRNEVALHVDKTAYDQQARFLRAHNYVYNDPSVQYRTDLVDQFPSQPAVPACLEACAQYVATEDCLDDVVQAQGPGSATTGAQAEREAAADDAQELTKWVSVLEDQLEDVSELTSLPALQGMLERMESQAGRVIANEMMSQIEDGNDVLQLDEIGRERLRNLCREFHKCCRKTSPGEDIFKLHQRVQALATNNCHVEDTSDAPAPSAPDMAVDSAAAADVPPEMSKASATDAQRKARLRVPTSRKAESWWNPKYWPIARPTDFCYGDCVWGIGQSPPHGDGPEKEAQYCFSVTDFIKNLFTREEMEYDLPDDEEKYVARPISRFRSSWYDVHLLHSFWRVTETTNSVYTYMKTPGAFGAAHACADLSPEMIEAVQLKAQQTGGKATLHSILKDNDTHKAVRAAFTSLGAATANLVGSDGHRRELRGEGESYTLRFGPPVQFITPNLADTKQPLILIVQGEQYTFEGDLGATYREMSQRIAADPVGQAVVFELMMRLFFIHVLGLRPETVGWRRGEARKVVSARETSNAHPSRPRRPPFSRLSSPDSPGDVHGARPPSPLLAPFPCSFLAPFWARERRASRHDLGRQWGRPLAARRNHNVVTVSTRPPANGPPTAWQPT